MADTAASGGLAKHLRLSDIRGLVQLISQATSGVTQIVEGVHHSVLNTMGLPAAGTPEQTRGITGGVYRSVHGVNKLLGKGLNTGLMGLEFLLESDADAGTPQREAFLAALNGVMGDRLVASNNPFALPMTLRSRNKVLNRQARPKSPETSGKIVLMIHGLCMTDLQRHAQRDRVPDLGAVLAEALGYTPVYLQYNTGRHISHNGRELAIQMEQLISHWPVPIEELSVVAHSMGGLLTRSAVHYAREQELSWPDHLQKIVFIGTPHHGAPLEKAGNWLDALLGVTPYSKPFAKLGQVRSAGITDLRYGHVLDDDWQELNRFDLHFDRRKLLPLPEGVACYTVAATTAEKRSALANRLVGDGLVPLNSALGHHDDRQKQLAFADDAQWIAYRTNHMQLLSCPDVSRQIVNWLTPSS